MREQASKGDELFTAVHYLWIQSHGMHQEVYPVVSSEVLTLVDVLLHIHIGDLYWLQRLNVPSYFDVFTADIANGDNTPHSVAAQQFGIGFHVLGTDRHSCQSQIGKGSLVFVILLIERHCDLVNDSVFAVFPYLAFYRLCFGTVNIVVLDDLFDLFQTGLNSLLIICGTILTKKIFQNVGWDRQSSLHEECEILSHHLAYEGIHYFLL